MEKNLLNELNFPYSLGGVSGENYLIQSDFDNMNKFERGIYNIFYDYIERLKDDKKIEFPSIGGKLLIDKNFVNSYLNEDLKLDLELIDYVNSSFFGKLISLTNEEDIALRRKLFKQKKAMELYFKWKEYNY